MLNCTATLIRLVHHEGTKDTKVAENHVQKFVLFVPFWRIERFSYGATTNTGLWRL
jgi:hypothetical protein